MELGLLLSSLWFGILTSISPCPLATNIAAVSFVGKKVGKPYYVLLSGFIYTLGRTLLYTALGFSLSFSMTAIPTVSHFLQTQMVYVVGPILILVGLIMLEIIPIKLPSFSMKDSSKERLDKLGLLGAFLLGVIFAAAFCPVSAALFFGNLVQNKGNILSLLLYGIGTGLPVLGLSFILAFSVKSLGSAYNKIVLFEKYARKITAIIFIVAGVYYIVSHF